MTIMYNLVTTTPTGSLNRLICPALTLLEWSLATKCTEKMTAHELNVMGY